MKKLLLTFLVMLMSLPAFSYDFKSGELHYNIIANDQVEVTFGEDSYIDGWSYPWQNNIKGDITIPASVSHNGKEYKVTSIGEDAFYDCSELTSVKIPDSVIKIGGWAFCYDRNLKEVEIGNSVVEIENGAFGEAAFETITLPSSLKILGPQVFRECPNLTKISIPGSVIEMGGSMFFGDFALKEIVFENGLEPLAIEYKSWTAVDEGYLCKNCPIERLYIGRDLYFQYDNGLNNFYFNTIPTLKEVEIGATVTTMRGNAFCDSPFETLIINCPKVGDYWFSDANSLREITFGDLVQTIGDSSFQNCLGLSELAFPSSLKTIGNFAFAGCKGITDLEITSGIEKISSGAFWGLEISQLTLPKNVKSVGSDAFGGCPIEKLNIYTTASYGDNAFSYEVLKEVICGDDATTIPSFAGASLLTDVTLPTSMESLPDNAFSYCISLKNLDLPSGLTGLGSHAFEGCYSLEKLSIPEKVTSVGAWAFSSCNSLIEIELPSGITYLSNGLFQNCLLLEKVKFSEKVNSFGNGVFSNCPSLRSINVPNGVTSIPDYFLANSTSITEIRLPNSVQTIGTNAFAGCTALMNVVLGTGTYDIANYAFEGCDNISDIYCMALVAPYAYQYTFPISSYTGATLYVQEQSLSKYTAQDPWQRFTRVNTMNSGIQLSHYDVNMAGNQVFQLGVYGTDSKVTWTASNPDVAYANECGLVVGRGITGSSIITATVDGVSVNCRVNVTSPRQVRGTRAGEDEDIQPVDIIIESIGGNPPMVNARLVPVGSKTVIDWSSSNSSVATVEDGLVTIISEGDVDFGAETGNGLEDSYDINTDNIDLSGVVVIENQETLSNDIYNLQGIRVKHNASQSDIDTLSPGIYFIGGKKVIVR